MSIYIYINMGGGGGGDDAPLSVLTSEELFPQHLSKHPYFQPHPGLIPHCNPIPRGPQEEMSDCWWAVRPEGDTDSTYAGHHLLCHLLTTMLTKLWSQTEWASPPESRSLLCPTTNLPMWTLWCSRLCSELPHARMEKWTPRLKPPC